MTPRRRNLTVAAGQVPFVLTAHLRGGISYDPPHGLDLAGILASSVRDRLRADLETEGAHITRALTDTTLEEPDDLTLPLAQCGTGENWHWAASTMRLTPDTPTTQDHPFNKNADVPWAAAMSTQPIPSVSPMRGPYRDARMPNIVAYASCATWTGIGDPVAVLDLVTGVRFLGRRRHVGEGAVLDWTITTPTIAKRSWFDWAHTAGSGKLVRPVPAECADLCSLTTPTEPVAYAIRPPSWHPDRLMDLVTSMEDDW